MDLKGVRFYITMDQLKNIVERMPVHILMEEYNKLRSKIVTQNYSNVEYSDLYKYYVIIDARVRKVMVAFDEMC